MVPGGFRTTCSRKVPGPGQVREGSGGQVREGSGAVCSPNAVGDNTWAYFGG